MHVNMCETKNEEKCQSYAFEKESRREVTLVVGVKNGRNYI